MGNNIIIYLASGNLYFEEGVAACKKITVKILFNVTVHIKIVFTDGSFQDYYQNACYYCSTSLFDSDALAFINAVGTLTSDQATIINNLVVSLKSYSLWSKFKAIYPFIGGTASAHKFNLISPIDLDSSFRLVFMNAFTHSDNGCIPAAVNSYAKTFYTPSFNEVLDSSHLSFYSRTNITSGSTVDIGSKSNSPASYSWLSWHYSVGYYHALQSGNVVSGANIASSLGLLANSRMINTTILRVVNSTISSIAHASSTIPTLPYFLFAYNNAGTPTAYCARQCAFASFGSGLSNTDLTNLYNIVQTYQTALGRQV
jgi:hypothetical protein